MANSFSKEERVAFDLLLEGFNDQLVMSKAVKVFKNDQTMMARTNDIIWRPQPYIGLSYQGLDQTGNFKDQTQLSVPARINQYKSSPFQMTALELRDALQENRLGNSAKQKLASDINVFITNLAAQQGTLVVKRTVAASGFDDLAQCDSIMNEQGVTSSMDRRIAAFSSRDYNSMAGNLAGRQTMNELPTTAYGRALVATNVSGFDVLKMDYAPRIVAATATGVTMTGANQFYTPAATTADVNGGGINVDNRYQTIGVTVAGSTIKVGDAFTITGVNAVHHITKVDTGQLKTFRVIGIVTGAGGTGTIQISPPIISGQGATTAELQYQNVTATPAALAPITFLNTQAAAINPFWTESAIELLPGRIAFPDDAGMNVMRATTDQGMEVVMVKQGSIDTGNIKYRVDTFFGGVMNNPEMCGIELFSQT
jgi:hypothetical protein